MTIGEFLFPGLGPNDASGEPSTLYYDRTRVECVPVPDAPALNGFLTTFTSKSGPATSELPTFPPPLRDADFHRLPEPATGAMAVALAGVVAAMLSRKRRR